MAVADLAFDRSERWKDQDGNLHVRVTNLSKATVNPYRGNEIPNWEALGLDPGRIYQLLRDPAELARAAATFNNLRLLSKHVAVSADDPKEELVAGTTGTDAVFEPPYLRNSLTIWRADDIAMVESKDKCQLSCAYYYDADMTPGTYEGSRYDGVMRNIRGNHVALVEAGRAGPDVMVHDSGETVMPTASLPLPSRKALLLKGALAAYLRPKLLPGTVLALDSALGSVNRLNWATQKPRVLAAIEGMAKGKLAADASLKDMHEFIDHLDGEEDGEAMDDEIEAMDESDAEEEREAREREEKEGKSAKDRAKGAKDRKAARDAKRAMDKAARDKKARDEESPEDKEKREREEKEAEDRRAKDGKKAMDAAIASASSETEKRVIARMTAAAEAREVVRPLIGAVSLALDSASAIYKVALDAAKIDVTGVDPSAYRAMVQMLPKPGAERKPLAMDHASAAGLASKFPSIARIGAA